MNPVEALQLILNAAALAQMPKQGHLQVEQAGAALRDFIALKTQDPKAVDGPEKATK